MLKVLMTQRHCICEEMRRLTCLYVSSIIRYTYKIKEGEKMNLNYILGRSGVGKTHKIYEDIKVRLSESDNNKLVLLVPEQFTLQGEADLISKMNLAGIMRLEVLSFSRMGFNILNELGGNKKTTIETIGKLMILRKLLEENKNELQVFTKGYNQDGFLENLCSLISEFKRCGVTTEELESRVESLKKDNMLKRKLQDINLIYKHFEEFLEGRYSDQDDKINLAIEKLEDSKYFEGSEIWIDGFSTFSAQEYKMMEKLFLKVKDVHISLTLDLDGQARDYDLFDPTRETYRRLSEICKTHNIEETRTVIERNYNKKSSGILHLERELFSYPHSNYNGNDNSISIFAAMNQYTEIENTAINIISIAREKDYRWRDISVVSNGLSIYNPIIKRVFSEYGIPYFIDEKRSVMNNSIVKFLLSSLEVIDRNFRYDDVFINIKTGFTDLEKDEYEKLENYCLEKGIRGNNWLKDFEYIGTINEENQVEKSSELKELNEIRVKFVKPLIDLKSNFKKNNTVKGRTKYIFEYLKQVGLDIKIDQLIEFQREKNNLEYVNENTQIWNIIMEVFDQLVEILDDKSISLKDYIKVLESGLSNFELGLIPPTMDQVLVGNLERSKSQDIKALFIVGVNDGLIPSGFSDGGILLDDEKTIIKQSGIELYSDYNTKVQEEKLSLYQALTKPTDHLFISYALGDKEGKALRPSIYIDRLRKVFKLEIKSDLIKTKDNSLNLISRPHSSFKYLTENLREKLDGHNIEDEWWDVYDWYYKNEEWQENLKLIIDGLFHHNQEEDIGSNYAKKLYNIPFKSSISSLETFAKCPFSYFIKKGLKPKERKEYSVNMPDIGTLFHNSIEDFSKELKKEKLNWNEITRVESDQLAEKVLKNMMGEFQNGILLSTHRYKYLTTKLERVSKRALWVLTEHLSEGKFEPLKHELSFGDKEDGIPPIIIDLPDGEKVILEGRIDRVDIFTENGTSYLKVIDYKSGNQKFELSDLYYGLQIQLVVYLDAVISNSSKLIKTESYPAGAFYFKIDDPIVNSVEKDKESIEKSIHKTLKMNGLVVNDIKVIEALDTNLKDGPKSNIIPVDIKKDGSPSANSSVYENDELNSLISHTRNLIADISTEILKGKIKIEPIKNDKKIPCEYCELSAICQFDTSFEDNKYRVLKKLGKKEVFEEIEKEKSKGGVK